MKLLALIFSKDRAMQLQAAIESFLLHCTDVAEMCVLYKATNELHQKQYEYLRGNFTNISFWEENDFKRQVLSIVSQFEYIVFLVDDNLFVRDFSMNEVITSLQANEDALGFSLRLGRNTNYCYPKNADQNLPEFKSAGEGILKYDWTEAEYDFGYPLEVSSSVYRARDILPLLNGLNYANPNTLEGGLVANAKGFACTKNQLLCYEQSAAFTNPINLVQAVTSNRAGNKEEYSSEELARLYEDDLAIDVKSYSGFVPNSCQQEVELKFIKENELSHSTI